MKLSLTEQATLYAQTHTDVSQAFIDGYNAALKTRSKTKPLDLSFIHPSFHCVMEKWLAYKKERKCAYTQRGAESAYKKLYQMSGGNATVGDQIVEQSIANNWQGLFELKNNGTQLTTSCLPKSQSVPGRRESVEQLVDIAGTVLRGIGGGYTP